MRLYNGCPDSELQAVWDSRDNARVQLQAVALAHGYGSVRCTYFPMEGEYQAWTNAPLYRPIGPPRQSVEAACYVAIEAMKEAA